MCYIQALELIIRIIIMSNFSWMLTLCQALYIVLCIYYVSHSILTFRGSSWDSEKLSGLPKVTHLISGQAEVQIQLSNFRPHTHHDHDHSSYCLKVLLNKWQWVAQNKKVSEDAHAQVISQHNKNSITFMFSICFPDRNLKYKRAGLKYETEMHSTIYREIALFAELVMWPRSASSHCFTVL